MRGPGIGIFTASQLALILGHQGSGPGKQEPNSAGFRHLLVRLLDSLQEVSKPWVEQI